MTLGRGLISTHEEARRHLLGLLRAGAPCEFTSTRTPSLLPGCLRVTVEQGAAVPPSGTLAFYLWLVRGALAPLLQRGLVAGVVGAILGLLAGFLVWGGAR